jgi:hypothetical protein
MTDEQEPRPRISFEYDPDIFETEVGPFDEGKLRAFLEQILIPNASEVARQILEEHPGLDIDRRYDGTFEVTTSYAGVYVGGFDRSAFQP